MVRKSDWCQLDPVFSAIRIEKSVGWIHNQISRTSQLPIWYHFSAIANNLHIPNTGIRFRKKSQMKNLIMGICFIRKVLKKTKKNDRSYSPKYTFIKLYESTSILNLEGVPAGPEWCHEMYPARCVSDLRKAERSLEPLQIGVWEKLPKRTAHVYRPVPVRLCLCRRNDSKISYVKKWKLNLKKKIKFLNNHMAQLRVQNGSR